MKVVHIAITVKDLEVSKAFYTNIFGFVFVNEFVKAETGAKFCYLDKDGFQLELWEFSTLKSVANNLVDFDVIGLRHIGFQVEDVAQEVARLNALGCNFPEAKVGTSGKTFSIGSDPDGILLELIN